MTGSDTVTASVSDALADLARTWGDRDCAERSERLASLVHPSWEGTPKVALMDAWADYMDAVLRHDDLCTACGTTDWHDYKDACATETDVRLMLAGWADDALKKLIDGPRRGAEGTGN